MKIEGWSDQSILYTNIKCHNGTRYSVQVIHNKEKQKFTNDEERFKLLKCFRGLP